MSIRDESITRRGQTNLCCAPSGLRLRFFQDFTQAFSLGYTPHAPPLSCACSNVLRYHRYGLHSSGPRIVNKVYRRNTTHSPLKKQRPSGGIPEGPLAGVEGLEPPTRWLTATGVRPGTQYRRGFPRYGHHQCGHNSVSYCKNPRARFIEREQARKLFHPNAN